MKYVGIKNCKSKQKALRYAQTHGRKVVLPVPFSASDCFRHKELLERFDQGNVRVNELRDTKYYKFNKSLNRSDTEIQRKIDGFLRLYQSIKFHGFNNKKSNIVLSNDGARLDGSHRSAIVEHLKYKEIEVIIVDWTECLTPGELKEMKTHLDEQNRIFS